MRTFNRFSEYSDSEIVVISENFNTSCSEQEHKAHLVERNRKHSFSLHMLCPCSKTIIFLQTLYDASTVDHETDLYLQYIPDSKSFQL